MKSGKERIRKVLLGGPDLSPRPHRAEAARVVIYAVIGCQFLGFLGAQAVGLVTNFTYKVPLGIFFGALFCLLLLVLGSRQDTHRPIGGFYRSFLLFLRGPSSKAPTSSDAAVEIVDYLLEHGLTSEGRLQGYLAKQGYPEELFEPALTMLTNDGFVQVRANGVTVPAIRRRQFY